MTNLEKFSTKLHDTRDVEVYGYVSKNIPEACKANGSQQMAFLNGRPVDLPKLVRIMNESYRALNPTNTRNSATPIFFLNFKIPMDMVDVNMSPDKRTVLFADQDIIFKMLQSALCLQLDPQAERTFALQVLPPMHASQAPPAPVGISPANAAPQLNEIHTMDIEDNNEEEAAHRNTIAPAPSSSQSNRAVSPEAIPSTQTNAIRAGVVHIDSSQESTAPATVSQQTSPTRPADRLPASQGDDDMDVLFESPKNHLKITNLHRMAIESDPENELELFEPAHKKTTTLPISMDEEEPALDIDLPATQAPAKKSSLAFALERYNRPAASPVTIREVRMSNIDAFASGSTQSAATIKETTQRRLDIAFSQAPPASNDLDAPSSHRDHPHDHGHSGCCSPSHRRSPTMDVDAADAPVSSAAPSAPIVEYDTPTLSRASTTVSMTASQALGQVSAKLPFNADRFAARYRSRCTRLAQAEVQQRELRDHLKALASGDWNHPHRIGNRTLRRFSPIAPSANNTAASEKKARSEMTKQVSKDDFAEMKVIGQFNGSFIICKLDDELFILDQHACDEKFNFEQLCKEKNVKIQRLIVPRRLELQPPDVAVIVDHLDEFSSRGFLIEYADVPPTPRASPAPTDLTTESTPSAPVPESSSTDTENAPLPRLNSSKSASFLSVKRENEGEDWRDVSPNHRLQLVGYVLNQSKLAPEAQIHEIIEAIRDGLQDMKLESEYKRHASQACRMSVMFGDHLPHRRMKEIVYNMSSMVQPWNCPHGRPTMRHLMTLSFRGSSKR